MEGKSLSFVNVRLAKDKTLGEGDKILDTKEAIKFIKDNIKDLDREHFIVLNLDTRSKVANAAIVSIGDLSKTIIHPREVFKTSILSNASQVIFFHNHPSGNPEPSNADINTTRRLSQAGSLLGIDVLDHIIVGESKSISLKEERGDLFCYSELTSGIIKEWNTEYLLATYEKNKIIEKYTDVKIERFIDGIPYEFKLEADEIRNIYEKLGKDKDLEWGISLAKQKYETKVAEQPECEIENFEMEM